MKLLRFLSPSLSSRRLSRIAVGAYVLFVLAPISFILYGTFDRYSRVIRGEVAASLEQTLAQAETNIRYRLDYMTDVANVFRVSPRLLEILGRHTEENTLLRQISDANELSNLLRSLEFNRNIERIRLFVDPSLLYSGERINIFPLTDLETSPDYRSLLAMELRPYLTGVHTERYIDKDPTRIFSLLCALRAPSPFDDVRGVLSVDIAEATVREVLAGIRFDRGELIALVGADGSVLSCADETLIGKPSAELFRFSAGNEPAASSAGVPTVRFRGVPSLFFRRNLSEPAWSLVALVPLDSLLERNRSFSMLTAFIVAVSGLLVLFLAGIVVAARAADRATERVREIGVQIERVGMAYLDMPKASAGGDLVRLETSVDQLLGTVGRLMADAAQARDKEHAAQLTALQAQINPHFLYNTLDSINWMAAARGAQDIRDLVEALARYFRLALSKGREIVGVGDELELIEAYLIVQRSRFGDRFSARVEVPDEILRALIPKLTLQPLVENALLHGIQRRRGKGGEITIRGEIREGEGRLAVRDNGPGMPLETAVALSERLGRNEASPSGGYGLQNVNERVKLYFGEAYGLSVASVIGEGTEILIRFPLCRPPVEPR